MIAEHGGVDILINNAGIVQGKSILDCDDEAIERNGFATVLYLRLVYFPFTPMNFGMGLTKVRFWDYIAGTGLGIIVGTFIFTFFIGNSLVGWVGGFYATMPTTSFWLMHAGFAGVTGVCFVVFKFFAKNHLKAASAD